MKTGASFELTDEDTRARLLGDQVRNCRPISISQRTQSFAVGSVDSFRPRIPLEVLSRAAR